MKNNLFHRFMLMVAEFFYCGRFPFAPGTVGSLASLLIWVPSVYCGWSLGLKLTLLIVLFLVGLAASAHGIAHYQKSDPKQVVIDEVVGQGLPFLLAAPSVIEAVLAFALFRFFDIVKPWPIKWFEKTGPAWWGVMVDDVVAGLFALALLRAWQILSFA